MFKATASPVAKLSVPLSVSVRFSWISTLTLGATVTVAPCDREVAGEDVAEVGRRGVPMAFNASVWPLARVSGRMSMSWN